jgi:hypothetical protein
MLLLLMFPGFCLHSFATQVLDGCIMSTLFYEPSTATLLLLMMMMMMFPSLLLTFLCDAGA